MTTLAIGSVLVEALDDDALALLAARLEPHLAEQLGANAGASEGWMASAEAAEYLGLSRHALHKLTAGRQIPFSQEGPGRRCYFRRSQLDDWRASSRH